MVAGQRHQTHNYNLRSRAPSSSGSGSSQHSAEVSRTPQTTPTPTPRDLPPTPSLWRRAAGNFNGKTPASNHSYNLRSSSKAAVASNGPGPIQREANVSTAQGTNSSKNPPPKPSLQRRAGVNPQNKKTPARNLRLPLQKARSKRKSIPTAKGTAGSSSQAAAKPTGGIQKPQMRRRRLSVKWVTPPQQRFRIRHFLATQATVSRLLTFPSTRGELLAALVDPVWITKLLCETIGAMKVELGVVGSLEHGFREISESLRGGARPVVVWFDDRASMRRVDRARPNYRRFRPPITENEWKSERFLLFLLSQRICVAIEKYNRCDQTDLQMCRTVLDSVSSDVVHNTGGVKDPFETEQALPATHTE